MKHLLPFLLFLLPFASTAQNWEVFGDSEYAIRSFYHDTTDNSLYIGGHFHWLGGKEVRGIARWDGNAFHQLGDFPNSFCNDDSCDGVLSIMGYKGDIYCTLINGPWEPGQIRGLAKWDGVGWDSIAGIKGIVFEQVVFNDELYIMGRFGMAEDNSVIGIVKWDGENWHDTGFNDWLGPMPDAGWVTINASAIFNGELYVGGGFWQFGTVPAGVARFDGTEWHAVGGGILGGDVGDLTVYKGELYACGDFHKTSADGGNMIAKLKDGKWVNVGGSFDYVSVSANKMLVWHDRLYVLLGAESEVGGGLPVDCIAVWDGERWCSLGSDFNNADTWGVLATAAVYNDTLIIGGSINYIDGIPYDNMAKWLGGDYLALCGDSVSATVQPDSEATFSLLPNPATTQAEFLLPNGFSNVTLNLYSTTSQLVLTQSLIAGSNIVALEALVPGLYFYEVRDEGRVLHTGKLVKVE